MNAEELAGIRIAIGVLIIVVGGLVLIHLSEKKVRIDLIDLDAYKTECYADLGRGQGIRPYPDIPGLVSGTWKKEEMALMQVNRAEAERIRQRIVGEAETYNKLCDLGRKVLSVADGPHVAFTTEAKPGIFVRVEKMHPTI